MEEVAGLVLKEKDGAGAAPDDVFRIDGCGVALLRSAAFWRLAAETPAVFLLPRSKLRAGVELVVGVTLFDVWRLKPVCSVVESVAGLLKLKPPVEGWEVVVDTAGVLNENPDAGVVRVVVEVEEEGAIL